MSFTPMSPQESIHDLIVRIAQELGVDPNLALATANQESGLNPNAIGDNGHSVGLFQLNDQGEGAGMSVQDRQNPETNARIALTEIARVAAQHPDWSPGHIAAAAQRPLDQAGYARSVDAAMGGAGYQASSPTQPTGTGGGPVGTQTPTQTFKAPAGGFVLLVNGGYPSIVYEVAPGVYLQFSYTDGLDTSALGQVDVSSEQYQSMHQKMYAAGSGKDLDAITKSWTDFGTFWSHILDQYLGPNQEARNDAGVLAVMAQVAARPDMSQEEIQNLLKGTNYWKSRTDGQIQWNDLSPTEQQKRIDDAKSQLRDAYIQFVGTDIDPKDATNQAFWDFWGNQVAKGNAGLNTAVQTWVKNYAAAQNPESPWQRTLRTEQENERQRGVDISNQVETARQTAAQWGVKLSDTTLKQWGGDIVSKKKSDADYVDYLRQQAHILYPWMKQLDPAGEKSTLDMATPWLQTYQRVMEKPADIFNPKIQAALSNGTPAWQFEQDLMKTPEWLNTKNSQDTFLTQVGDVGRRMGFS